MCLLRLSMIGRIELYTYGGLFICGGIIASFVNLIAIVVLWMPKQRTKSNYILTSLVIADLLTGVMLFPVNAYQVIRNGAVLNCMLDIIRAYMAVFLAGASALTLAIVAFDRYILLTRYSRYNQIVSKKNINMLLLFSWVFPLLTPLVRFIHPLVYLCLLILIFLGPLVALIIFYILLIRAIMKVQKTLASHYHQNELHVEKEIKDTFQNNCHGEPRNPKNLTEDHEKRPATNSTEEGNGNNNNADNGQCNNINSKILMKWKKSQQKSVRTGKSVAVLILCYFMCFVTLHVWIILDIFNIFWKFVDPKALQHLYLLCIFTGSFNSCINPFIYFAKQPGFKKRVKKLFGRFFKNKT